MGDFLPKEREEKRETEKRKSPVEWCLFSIWFCIFYYCNMFLSCCANCKPAPWNAEFIKILSQTCEDASRYKLKGEKNWCNHCLRLNRWRRSRRQQLMKRLRRSLEKMFQRLFGETDEIAMLQGFIGFTFTRGDSLREHGCLLWLISMLPNLRYLQSSRSVAERVMEATGVKSLSGKTFVWTDPFSFLWMCRF